MVPWPLGVGTFSASFAFDTGYRFSMVCLESISWCFPSEVFRVPLDQPSILWGLDPRSIDVVLTTVRWFCYHEDGPQKQGSP